MVRYSHLTLKISKILSCDTETLYILCLKSVPVSGFFFICFLFTCMLSTLFTCVLSIYLHTFHLLCLSLYIFSYSWHHPSITQLITFIISIYFLIFRKYFYYFLSAEAPSRLMTWLTFCLLKVTFPATMFRKCWQQSTFIHI